MVGSYRFAAIAVIPACYYDTFLSLNLSKICLLICCMSPVCAFMLSVSVSHRKRNTVIALITCAESPLKAESQSLRLFAQVAHRWNHAMKAQKTATNTQMYFQQKRNVKSIKPQLVTSKAQHRQCQSYTHTQNKNT